MPTALPPGDDVPALVHTARAADPAPGEQQILVFRGAQAGRLADAAERRLVPSGGGRWVRAALSSRDLARRRSAESSRVLIVTLSTPREWADYFGADYAPVPPTANAARPASVGARASPVAAAAVDDRVSLACAECGRECADPLDAKIASCGCWVCYPCGFALIPQTDCSMCSVMGLMR